ncbi:hypothetical protein OROGR_029382 [Orobanche gracilis]
MGNCQAIDSASLAIQHPNGRVDQMYGPITASKIMNMNPGHYVALLLTTTLYHPPSTAATAAGAHRNSHSVNSNKSIPLRITKIKLLRPTDTLVLGHVYRLVTSQEVMKGLLARKQDRMKQNGKIMTENIITEFEAVIRKNHEMEKETKQVKLEKHRSRNNKPVINSVMSKSKGWQPSLKSISEAAAGS